MPPAPSGAIETNSLTKAYRSRPVVRDLTFSVAPGEVYALVGPNGAGKTTVIRLISGLAFPTSGEVRLLGLDPHRNTLVRKRLGAVVEAPAAFYPYLTGRANLELHASLAGGVPAGRIGEVLDKVELGSAADRNVGAYSLGMRQRLGLAAALLTDPRVLILDEPASGMDPLSLHLVHELLQRAAEGGAAVLLSTHHLEQVGEYCDRVGILEQGILIDEVDLKNRASRYRALVSDPSAAAVQLSTQVFVTGAQVRGEAVVFSLERPEQLSRVAGVLGDAGILLHELGPDRFNLAIYYAERLAGSKGVPRQRAPGAGA